MSELVMSQQHVLSLSGPRRSLLHVGLKHGYPLRYEALLPHVVGFFFFTLTIGKNVNGLAFMSRFYPLL